MAIRTKSRKKNSSLSKRAKISYSMKDQGGGGSRVINWRNASKEVQFFQPVEGKNAINIIPFEIKSKNHPLVKQGQMEIGELDYCLDIWTHRNIGPSESAVICLKKTYGKACPICEEADKLKKAGKEKEAAALAAKHRIFYNVEDTRRKPGVLQVFEVSYYLFEKELIDEARNEDEGEDSFIDFADPVSGFIVRFRCTKTSQGGFEYNEFKSFSFTEREDPIEEDLLTAAISFDEHLNLLNYEEVQAILYGADEDSEDDEEDEKPARKKTSVKKATKRTTNEDEDETDDDEVSTKKVSSVKPKKRPVASEEDDEDDEDEDEDEDEDDDSPPVKKREEKSSAKMKCPHGHTFGEDADGYKECEDCDIWAKCVGGKK